LQLRYFWFGVKYMSIKKKQSLGIVVTDINFFFSHRAGLAKRLSERFEILVFSDISKINKSKLNKYAFLKFIHLKSRVKKNKFINLLSVIRYGVSLAKLLKSNRLDIVFFITLECSMIGAVASIYLKSKNFFIISGAYALRKNKSIRLIATKVFSFFKSINNKFIFQNIEDQMLFEEMLGNKHVSFVIKGNGINLSSINYEFINSVDTVKFLFASNLFYAKGVKEYYDAAVALKNLNINANFYMAGAYIENHPLSINKSLYKNIIRSKALEYLGEWDKKTFLNNITNYHIFVLPSFGEGMPLAVMEAMASGRAIICSNVPGCNSCVHKNLNGYFCEAHSSESLIRSIKKMVVNKKEISNMGAYSRRMIEKEFEEDLIHRKYLDVINA
jgi:glycosyltransferase involved in cell wall biosynthesis